MLSFVLLSCLFYHFVVRKNTKNKYYVIRPWIPPSNHYGSFSLTHVFAPVLLCLIRGLYVTVSMVNVLAVVCCYYYSPFSLSAEPTWYGDDGRGHCRQYYCFTLSANLLDTRDIRKVVVVVVPKYARIGFRSIPAAPYRCLRSFGSRAIFWPWAAIASGRWNSDLEPEDWETVSVPIRRSADFA